MKAVRGYIVGMFALCHITKVQLFQCGQESESNSLSCILGTCCSPDDKVVKPPAFIEWTWFYCTLGNYNMYEERPNKICVHVLGICKVTLYYCYLKDTPYSRTTTEATFSSTTRLVNVSDSPITFENTSIHQSVTSGGQESTEIYSYTPVTSEANVSIRMISTSVSVIASVSIAALALAIFGVAILLGIRLRRKRYPKRATADTCNIATVSSNREHNEDEECDNSHEGIASISLPSLNGVSADTIYAEIDKGRKAKVTEQVPILAFRNYSNYCNVQCADSNDENAYDSTDLQTSYAVIENACDHTVSIANCHDVIEDEYDHTFKIDNSNTYN
ncbi:hypothetical protein CHS0354_034801 [Potamilus streckersoni]|uniref:Uncharacterized protein n=1 Tax=Potamilus streckersoni TaxID=2493646 RepID=A0AAE0RSY6_9BIVA|nr:hypothetical protein CHS0354_034801 [Potamilus streckersoni]